MGRIEPLMPRGRRGAHRVDDRRIISSIVHMLRSGARRRDCPTAYGPYTTVYNRWSRQQGPWLEIFEALTGQNPIYGLAMIDSTHIKAHRSAGGGKGGPTSRRSASRAAVGRASSAR
jgi:transposase